MSVFPEKNIQREKREAGETTREIPNVVHVSVWGMWVKGKWNHVYCVHNSSVILKLSQKLG